MTCPYCDFGGSIRDLHAHLAERHGGEISTEDIGDRKAYIVTCPYCSQSYRQPIKKSAGDPEFLAEFERQIRLVAFDMLINHVLAEHGMERVEP
ncbi:hypothetical protein DVS77_02735 [Mycolicibacterium moriokaense]|nr:hypothetical protein DVS77_02735 [Mycolicibacterium moriokaense]